VIKLEDLSENSEEQANQIAIFQKQWAFTYVKRNLHLIYYILAKNAKHVFFLSVGAKRAVPQSAKLGIEDINKTV